METGFGDRLTVAIRRKRAAVCVGIDPDFDRLPVAVTGQAGGGSAIDSPSALNAVREFCRTVLRLVAPRVPAVKINIAFFERFFAEGVAAYYDLVGEAHDLGLIVIGDVKRADIGHSSAMYAWAHLATAESGHPAGVTTPDAITINPYFGFDGVGPFLDAARTYGKGAFALVQTSNASAGQVQGQVLASGGTVAEHVARLVDEWASDQRLMGSSGYSALGAVVAPRDRQATLRLRALMPRCIFLVPGFGAQGRGTDDVAACFNPDGTGAIVNASRSVLYAYEQPKYREKHSKSWEGCVEAACGDFVEAVRQVAAPS